MKTIGEPDVGKLQVRFDEGIAGENPASYSTLVFFDINLSFKEI